MSIHKLSGIIGVASLFASGAFADSVAPPAAPPAVSPTVIAVAGETSSGPYVSSGGATSTVGGAMRDYFGNIQVQPVETIGMRQARARAQAIVKAIDIGRQISQEVAQRGSLAQATN